MDPSFTQQVQRSALVTPTQERWARFQILYLYSSAFSILIYITSHLCNSESNMCGVIIHPLVQSD